MPSDQQISAFLASPENVLYAADWRSGLLGFVPASRQALSDLPFLDNRTLGTSQKKAALPFDQVARLFSGTGTCDFLFHSAFCCSTLIARVLDFPGKCLSLKEPFALLGLSGLKRNAPAEAWATWAGAVLPLLARPFSPGERTLLKPSNGANNLLPEILGQTGAGKAVLLYSDLESFLVSVLSGGPERARFVSGILELFRKDFGGDLAGLVAPTPLHEAALAWGLQLRLFEKTAKEMGPDKVRTLDCQRFLENPGETLSRLSAFYGYGLTPDEAKDIVAGPLMTRHAKEGRAFEAGERAAEKLQVLKTNSGEIAGAVTWTRQNDLDFSKGLSHPL